MFQDTPHCIYSKTLRHLENMTCVLKHVPCTVIFLMLSISILTGRPCHRNARKAACGGVNNLQHVAHGQLALGIGARPVFPPTTRALEPFFPTMLDSLAVQAEVQTIFEPADKHQVDALLNG